MWVFEVCGDFYASDLLVNSLICFIFYYPDSRIFQFMSFD